MKRLIVALILAFGLVIPLGAEKKSGYSLSQMLHRVQDSTAMVFVQFNDGDTGVCTAWSPRPYQWVTAKHCKGDTMYIGDEILKVSKETDDLLLMNGPLVSPLVVAKDQPDLGEDVYLFGYPDGYVWEKALFFHGMVNTLPHEDADLSHGSYGIDATGYFGMSGGPIVNSKGEVVGVNEATSANYPEMWSQPLSVLRKFLK